MNFARRLARGLDMKATLDVLLEDAPIGHVFRAADIPRKFGGHMIEHYVALGADFRGTLLFPAPGAPGKYIVARTAQRRLQDGGTP